MVVLSLVSCSAASTSRTQQPEPHREAERENTAAPVVPDDAARQVLTGRASYYADSLAGNLTASGERYDPQKLTAAHRTLPFGSVVRVTRLDTGASVTVRITDRGPFAGREQGRIIDLSRAAAENIDMIRRGVVDVRVEVLR